MRILYITTITGTMHFFKSIVKELVDAGHRVDFASNNEEGYDTEFFTSLGCNFYPLSCSRSPFMAGNLKAINEIKQIVDQGQYDIVHCHTPIAAACTRIACKKTREKRVYTGHPLRVFYTAHGFHFYKGAPFKNWILYYPIEWLCAHWTDVLITINLEDFECAKTQFNGLGRSALFCGCKTEYIPGVGIDVKKYALCSVDKTKKRKELGIPEDSFLILSVGELNENKNHSLVIDAIAELDKEPWVQYYYIVAGDGPLKEFLQNKINFLGLQEKILLLGYRKDCSELYKTADLLIHPSFREGLPVSVMEAKAAGLKCIVSDIRGNSDLVIKENRFDPKRVDEVIEKITHYSTKECVDISIFDYKNVNKMIRLLYG